MSLLHDSPERTDAAPPTRRFRASTIDAALAEARAELGPDIELVEANRIRRGGVGGFFAADLGVEVSVRPAVLGPGGIDNDDDFEARLAFLDRMIAGHESAAGAGIDRLLERAANADGAASADGSATRSVWSDEAAAPAQTFVDHLAQQLAELDGTPPLPRRTRRDVPDHTEQSQPASIDVGEPDVPITPGPTAGAPETPTSNEPTSDTDPDESNPAVVRSVPRRAERATRPASSAPREHTEGGSPASMPRAVLDRAASPGRTSMALQRADDLAAGAIGRLVAELSDVVPTNGSRIGQLSRLTISVTAADGSIVEMSAELDGPKDG